MFALLLTLLANDPSQNGKPMPEVWIEHTDRGGGVIELVALARSDRDMAADFRLNVIRQTDGNAARTRQGGHVELKAGEARRLSVVAVGPVRSVADLNVELELESGGQVVAEARLPAGSD